MFRTSLHYGWKPDLPDHRDFKFAAPKPLLKKLPAKMDLRSKCPPVYDQGQLGSCTGNAIAAAFQFELMKQKAPVFFPSRLFIYYNERVMENTVKIDNGAEIRDGIKSVATLGVCPEPMWPYVINEFAQKPFKDCYSDAMKHKAIVYSRIEQDISLMKGCLAEGYPFVGGFTVYSSFESVKVARTGIVNIPHHSEKIVGGHAILVVGYDDAKKRFIVRNSWGNGWGMKGYFTIPYTYFLNSDLASDFWTIRTVAKNPAVKRQKKS